jgi:choline dehydrogenase
VGPATVRHPIAEAGLAAAVEVGYRRATDLSGGLEEGFGWGDLNIVAGRRQSAADAYLTSALGRPNLRVVTDALVHRVRLHAGRCIGVVYSVGTEVFAASCSGEVVLTAGTVGSAQLLMLSGIGPQSHLREVGVDVVVDLPGVGANLHDHPMCGIVYRSAQPVPAGVNNHGEAMGLIRSNAAIDTPDLQIMFVDVPLREDNLPGRDMSASYTIVVALMRPDSRGSVRLADAAPGTAPVIDPNYYTEPRDLDAVATGLRAARKIGGSAALDRWRGEEVLPGLDVQDEESLRAYPRTNLRSYSHYAGTCRIGPAETVSSTPSCACTASADSGWPTPLSCPHPSPRTRTRPSTP